MKKMLMLFLGAAISMTSCNDAGEEPEEVFTQKDQENSKYLDSIKAANTSPTVKDDQSHWASN